MTKLLTENRPPVRPDALLAATKQELERNPPKRKPTFDPMELRVLERFNDRRERTEGDLVTEFGLTKNAARRILRKLKRHNLVKFEQLKGCGTVWRRA